MKRLTVLLGLIIAAYGWYVVSYLTPFNFSNHGAITSMATIYGPMVIVAIAWCYYHHFRDTKDLITTFKYLGVNMAIFFAILIWLNSLDSHNSAIGKWWVCGYEGNRMFFLMYFITFQNIVMILHKKEYRVIMRYLHRYASPNKPCQA